ncbi:Uma2 family endonuclease [Gloeobacter morelensis]|uniref:Uma2 family endonuclease n=1 Tax=Gloeobacter morelensis MG652769 TaxID=2781736 RepID=A0ABY3PQK8_9CYAN|nr:Uma2 family endonuclease [Gloeobacter morelensis]UFP95940.1 Uma2 family endonuclease [Gloeobacter morelensis MG652769]
MTTLLAPITYPSGDGLPVAETFVHLYAILTTLEVLKQYLEGQQATVLANQFLYYAPGVPTARVAPDVMVIFGVAPGGRDNYKTWEEGQVPAIIFEVTSAATQKKDQGDKKTLYALLGVREYWLFDPRGEWIPQRLQGNRLENFIEEGEPVNRYAPIQDGISQPLGLRLQVEDDLIGFYRLDNGQKLLIPAELASELRSTAARLELEQQARMQAEQQAAQEQQARIQAEQQAAQERLARIQAEQRAATLAERLRELGIDPEQF